MHFLLDMGISPLTGKHLMNNGHDAVHLVEHDMHRFSDKDIIEYARNENRIILTHDLDFGRLLAISGKDP